MTKDLIISKVNEFLVDEFEVESSKIVPEANMRETLDLDSLDYVDLVVVIESNFGFKVVGEDFINIHSFQDFYDYCHQKVSQKDAA
ncbi:phosphopantetheine-binding protein [Aurantibacillus circumpalustris]|uniref:phosphopantetheine-binding protein n=1 Tax=Aurantibacillus circumpalustris TaxID=3036359 RepID=UPI00295ADC4B|nr:phosphopantetheine-binding protein [Aurantibacillus circumpalustris]